MNFTKMHGAGNDYIYVDCFKETINNPELIAQKVSDRHKGIGSDGLILILPSESADCMMRIFNADGSEGKMCGNGIRCVAKFMFDHHYVDSPTVKVDTLSGIKTIQLTIHNTVATEACVNMGKAEFRATEIPVTTSQETFINQSITIQDTAYQATAVSMGNPHLVLFVEEAVQTLNLPKIGPAFENCPLFPESINTEFIHIRNRHEIEMRVWERGSGETLACGTGACASVIAGIKVGHLDYNTDITVHLLGGELSIRCLPDNTVYMTGEAIEVFTGSINI